MRSSVTANAPSDQSSPPLPPGPAGVAQALYLQIAATLLVGLPHGLGNNVVCGPCAIWPLPTDGVTAGALVWTVVRLGRVHVLRYSLLGTDGVPPRA